MHAGWNLLLSRARDSEAATAVALAAGAIAFAPLAAATWRVDSAALPYAAGSAALEPCTWAMLARAYQEGELSVVYPVARGSAPPLILAFSVTVLGHSLSAPAVIGILLVAGGVVAVRGRNSATSGRDLALALAIGVCIASYTLLDKQGLKHASPLAYLELVVAVPALIYVPVFAHRRGTAALRAELGVPAVLAGVGMFGAFGLALAAIKLAPSAALAAVQAVRESSVVIAVVLARLLLGERVTGVRLVGAICVVAGVAAIAAA